MEPKDGRYDCGRADLAGDIQDSPYGTVAEFAKIRLCGSAHTINASGSTSSSAASNPTVIAVLMQLSNADLVRDAAHADRVDGDDSTAVGELMSTPYTMKYTL
ncbi:MAG TPA: hypothetical protein VGM75_08130 [Pseudonocardiaceae bacterium]